MIVGMLAGIMELPEKNVEKALYVSLAFDAALESIYMIVTVPLSDKGTVFLT